MKALSLVKLIFLFIFLDSTAVSLVNLHSFVLDGIQYFASDYSWAFVQFISGVVSLYSIWSYRK